ncbi:MAG: hypothetical protein GY749_44150 [Desulfobacteraceae bacterium]|nr:hypothetical protein [Desulfobacteraceae bacterium]
MKNHIIISILIAIALASCRPVTPEPEYNYNYGEQLEKVRNQMTRGHSAEAEVDKKILEAVTQLAATLEPEYKKKYRRKRYKLGFIEMSDTYRRKVGMLHKYVTEKAVTFTFLQPDIVKNFNIGERFLLQQIMKSACINDRDCYYPTVDLTLAKWLGNNYNVDIVETGVITESPDFLDINLRLIETGSPRVIAVGSSKIEKTKLIEKWLCEIGTVCW